MRGVLRCLLLCTLPALPGLLSGCGGPRYASVRTTPERNDYPAPGPADDPWGPYIDEASSRFDVPGQWVRAVMHQESGGHEYLDGQPITSAAGAIGLMQLMPATYADLEQQYGLGDDPFEPHDNIMAGTGYIRQMYDRYGSPGFLAAYNAGPARVDDYLAGQGGLPNETVNYVAAIAPHLGGASAGAGGGSGVRFAQRRRVAPTAPVRMAGVACPGADPDAAYDPDAPCTPTAAWPAPAPEPPVEAASPPPGAAFCADDPDAAYDPEAPCHPLPTAPASYSPAPSALGAAAIAPPSGMRHFAVATRTVPPEAVSRGLSPVTVARSSRVRFEPPSARLASAGSWSVQVGAFGRIEEARFAISMARDAAPPLESAAGAVSTVGGLGGHDMYRARLGGLARGQAASACDRLRTQSLACIVVPPGA